MNLSSRCMVLALGLLASSSSTMAGGDMKLLSRSKQAFEFERAMKMGVQKSKQERNLKAKLNEKLLEKAVFVPPTKTEPEFMTENAGRKLANYYGGDDQYYGFGFDISTYSLKYTQCQAISTWSDELAEDEDSESVLRTQRFALFRLCPSDICSADNQYGCSYNYGEYILDMADYLEAMQQYTAERFEAFCEFCEECMEENDDAGAAADDGGNNGYYAAADDAAANDGYYAAAGDDAAADDGAGNNNGYYSSCAYYTQCSNYANVCEAQDADDVIDYEDFFECQMFEGSNGKELYLGPHCGSDGRSIGIGLYYDDMCTQYAGKDYDIQSFTGMTFDDEALSAYYDTECVSCLESNLPYNQVQDDVNDADAITELCENLYMQSAKCNQALGDVYTNQNEENAENMVCFYIGNIVMNKYDEMGEIYLNNFDFREYVSTAIEHATGAQIVTLGSMIFICVSLMMYACYLHRALTGGGGSANVGEWAPRKGLYYGDISRQSSGIVMGRSRSGGSFDGGIMA